MNTQYVIQCTNLKKEFSEIGSTIQVLREVNLKVEQGERLAIVGSSGSGKSTLLHLLGGLDVATEGNIELAGVEINSLNETKKGQLRNKALGFVYQLHHLLPEFTALENVSIPLLIRRENPKIAQELAEHILGRVGLGRRLYHKPGELSGGERQRAALARALVAKPLCVLADEPTGNLDHKTAEQVYELMIELNEELKTSFIIVSHDMALVERMSKVYVLEDGILRQER